MLRVMLEGAQIPDVFKNEVAIETMFHFISRYMDAFITQWSIKCNHQDWKMMFSGDLCHHFACNLAERLLHISASC
jgi:hypothetical protein